MLKAAPDGTTNRRYLHRVKAPTLSGRGNYGFDTILAGKEMESQALDSNAVAEPFPPGAGEIVFVG